MREITELLGMEDKPIEMTLPTDLVRHIKLRSSFLTHNFASTLRLCHPTMLLSLSLSHSLRRYVKWKFKILPPLTYLQKMDNVLAEWLAKQNKSQCHIAGQFAPFILSISLMLYAETEKYGS